MTKLTVSGVSARPLSAEAIRDRELFDAMIDRGAQWTATSAAKWQAGLLAIVGFLTGGLFLKDPKDAQLLSHPWNHVVVFAIVAALAAASAGLLLFTAVSAGVVVTANRDRVAKKYGAISAFIRHRERRASHCTLIGIWLAYVSIALLVTGAGVWALAPRDSKRDSFQIKNGERLVCANSIERQGDDWSVLDSNNKIVLRIPIKAGLPPIEDC